MYCSANQPDIVERLYGDFSCVDDEADAMHEAADEITRLRQQVQELQAELACYRPDENWKSAYLEQVNLHNATLDELRIAEQRVQELERQMAEELK